MLERFIVAEVSKNWPENDDVWPRLLAERFEAVINTNWARGYRLVDWRLDRLMKESPDGTLLMNETIIAVFEYMEMG
jgi:hypothetical protein